MERIASRACGRERRAMALMRARCLRGFGRALLLHNDAKRALIVGGFRRGACARYGLALCAALAWLTGSRTTLAQEWLRDRRFEEGPGIREGNLEIHPGLGAEAGFDSNWFLRSPKSDERLINGAPSAPPVGAAVLRITPSLRLQSIAGPRLEGPDGMRSTAPIAFRAGASATYREFLAAPEVSAERNLAVAASGGIDIHQWRPLGANLRLSYQRIVQPTAVADPNFSFTHNDINVGGEVVAIPGGGALDLRAGYQFFGSFYERLNSIPFSNVTHDLTVKNRWKFRPRTALFHDTSLRFVSYPNASQAPNFLNSSSPLRTAIGLSGLVTERVGALVSVGYGATFFDAPPASPGGAGDTRLQYDGVTAQVEGTYHFFGSGPAAEGGGLSVLLSNVSVGYLRDFNTSLLSNYYTSDKAYSRLVYVVAGRAVIQFEAAVEAMSYPQPYLNSSAGPVAAVGPLGVPVGEFTNYRWIGKWFAEYRLSNSFAVNATVDYSRISSDTQLELGDPLRTGRSQLFDLEWRRLQAFAGVRWSL